MQLHVNERLLRRRLRISVVLMVGSLLLLAAGFVASVSMSDPLLQYLVSIPPLIVGLILWARNQEYLQRWGPRTRQDRIILHALRGLDARYHLLVAPADGLPDYLLVGPMGILVLVPRPVAGSVTCDQDRWSHGEQRPLLVRLLTWFSVRPVLGNPTVEVEQGVERTRQRLAHDLSEQAARAPIEGVVLFTHPAVTLTIRGSRVPALLLKSLRPHVRHLPRPLGGHEVQELVAALTAV